MASTMTRTETFEFGIAHRRNMRILLGQLDIPYVEHKGLITSTFIVKVSQANRLSYKIFLNEVQILIQEIEARDEARALEEWQAEKAKSDSRLARKNNWRKMTFRKPVSS